jgi:hypothetical protein
VNVAVGWFEREKESNKYSHTQVGSQQSFGREVAGLSSAVLMLTGSLTGGTDIKAGYFVLCTASFGPNTWPTGDAHLMAPEIEQEQAWRQPSPVT